jgi:hypothetical protein
VYFETSRHDTGVKAWAAAPGKSFSLFITIQIGLIQFDFEEPVSPKPSHNRNLLIFFYIPLSAQSFCPAKVG